MRGDIMARFVNARLDSQCKTLTKIARKYGKTKAYFSQVVNYDEPNPKIRQFLAKELGFKGWADMEAQAQAWESMDSTFNHEKENAV